MKKTFVLFLIICLFLTNTPPAHAAENTQSEPSFKGSIVFDKILQQVCKVTLYSDGSKLIETVPQTISSVAGTITKQKEYYRTDSNENLLWKATLIGTFTYNGSTSSCTAASCTTTIYNSAWSEQSVNAYTSGASANADVTMVRKFLFITVETVSIFLTMSCDKDGNVY